MDEGKNAQLVFEILSEKTQKLNSLVREDTNYFAVNNAGEIFLKNKVDFEAERMIDITIGISDVSNKPLDIKKTIKCKIMNVNDNKPQFVSFPMIHGDRDNCRLEISEGIIQHYSIKFQTKPLKRLFFFKVTTTPTIFFIPSRLSMPTTSLLLLTIK